MLPNESIPLSRHQLRHKKISIKSISLTPNVASGSQCNTHTKDPKKTFPIDFEPGTYDVICSQGKKAKNHPGNVYFEQLIQERAKEYADAVGKKEKSTIVRDIIKLVQSQSPRGGFVKKTTTYGICQWQIVDAEQAREKVSQTLRNALAGNYRSSSVAKKRSRKESNLKRIVDFEDIVASNQFVSATMLELSNTIENNNNRTSGGNLSDKQLLHLMTQTNIAILRQLKEDKIVQHSVQPKSEQHQLEGDNNHDEECDGTFFAQPCCTVDESLKRFHVDKEYMLLQQPNSKRRRTR